MEKFQNSTLNNKEKAIKIGTNVPADGVNLSWFENNEITPINNISTIDLSETIPENNLNSTSDNEAFIALADEMGILKTLDNKYGFSSDQLTLSNLFLNKQTTTEAQDLNQLNPNEFVHHYYISRYFISAPSNFFVTDINHYLDQSRLGSLKLKILDQNGLDYIDLNTGRKKYRFLLEPFVTGTNRNRYEIPHRVIVLFDSTEPVNLKLNYDKIESDKDGNMFHQELNYLESINAIPLFEEIPEESFVIDNNYRNKKNFSITKINQKYSSLVNAENLNGGYQIVAPSKPIDDNRTFEVFNWRFIARSKNTVNLNLINEDLSSAIINKTLKVAVLYSSLSSQSNSTIFPYIFYRLENSPFNLNSYNFINPLQEDNDIAKTSAEYWKVDIDSVQSLDDFDVLAWSPDTDITSNQASKINSFLMKNGTILLDLSYINVSARRVHPQLELSTARVVGQVESLDLDNVLIDNNKNGGWEINSSIFEKEEYGIYGSRYNFDSDTYKSYFYFQETVDQNSIIKLGQSESSDQTVGVIIPYVPVTDSLVRGNIIGVTFRLMSYCNSIYSISSPEQVVSSNSDSTSYNLENGNIFSAIVEGPFKFLYNSVAFAAYCRLQAGRELRTNSSLYNYVSNWDSSWVMDGNALFQDEIEEYFTSVSVGSQNVYARKLTQNSIVDSYKNQIETFMQSHHQDTIFGNTTDLEIFIESTNGDVVFSNTEPITSEEANINSSYYLYKVTNLNTPIFAYATLDKVSPLFTIPSGLGPYVIRAKDYSLSNTSILNNGLNISNTFKSYPFSLRSRFSYLTGTDKPINFNTEFTTSLKMVFKGSLTETSTVVVNPDPVTSLVDTTLNCVSIKSAIDDLGFLRETVSSKPTNIFLYTGDIDIHKDPRIWKATYTTPTTTSGAETTLPDNLIKSGTYFPQAVYSQLNYTTAKSFVDDLRFSGLKKTYTFSNYSYEVTLVPNTSTYPTTVIFNTIINSTQGVTSTSAISTTKHEYVKYIQYTMSAANNSSIVIDGIYGSQTTNAVLSFQKANSQRFIDGTVDSETKSFMAFYWKNLKKNNLTKFNTLRNAALNNTNLLPLVKYLDAAVAAGTTSDINTKTYKKITFSGFSGPGEGMDILFFKIPDSIEKVGKIVIEADSSSVWRNWSITQMGYASSYSSNIFNYNVISVGKNALSGKIEIPLNQINGSNARYLWIQVVGNGLSGYGYAEGFSIKSMKVFGKAYVTSQPDPETEERIDTYDIYALATINVEDLFENINTINYPSKNYLTNSFPRSTASFESLIIDCLNDGTVPSVNLLSSGPISLNAGDLAQLSLTSNNEVSFSNGKIKFNFSSSPSLIWAEGLDVISTVSDNVEVTGDPISVSYENSADKKSVTITTATSAAFYSDGFYHEIGPINLSTGYKLRKPNQTTLIDSRNSVTANDGVMLLCRQDNSPFGILDSIDITSGLNNTSSISDEEINISYGSFSLSNTFGELDGFVYGFYDRNKLEFLGKSISYIDLINRGIGNVFIAVYAFDIDGNTLNQREYIGPSSNTIFMNPRIPLKTAYPIYSVKLKKSSSIRVSQMDANLSKFDIWSIPVSSGSFWKDFRLDQSRIWGDWKADYLGQTLRAFYTTFDDLIEEGSSGLNSTSTVWSEIYGYGHYDIKDETPILLDDRTIRLRRAPLMSINYPTDYLTGVFGIIKQEIKIYTRTNENANWTEISHEAIRDINASDGIIKFRSRVVPSNDKLIKVSYVTANKNRLIHQINGDLIPLNPLFASVTKANEKSKLRFDSPLYVYITPKYIYKDKVTFSPSGLRSSTFVKIDDYRCESTLNFTYDERIFNKESSKFDPFALPIAIIYVKNNPYNLAPKLFDTRVRGGGVKVDYSTVQLMDQLPDVLSSWDVYPPSGAAHAMGGYVIIRIPESVKEHFLDEKEIYQIISNNLTAGIAYELQDTDGNSWN